MGLRQKLERALARRIALIQEVADEPRADRLVASTASLALSRRAKLGVVIACYGAALKAVDEHRPLGDPVKTCVRAVGRALAERFPEDAAFDPRNVNELKLTEKLMKAIGQRGRQDIGRGPEPPEAPLSRADAELACTRHLMDVVEGDLTHAGSVVELAARAIAWEDGVIEDALLALGRELQGVLSRDGVSILISDLMWLKLEGHRPKEVLFMVERSIQH
jgi:hypothetical protein